MPGQFAVADTHGRDLGKDRLQGIHELGSQLVIHASAKIRLLHVSGDIGIEEEGVLHLVGIFTEGLDGDVDIKPDVLVDDPEGNCVGRTELIVHHFLHIEVIDPLILARVTAESEALADALEGTDNILTQGTVEKRRFRRSIVDILTGLGREIHHLALFNNNHALTVVDGDDGAIRDNVVFTLDIAAS